MIMTQERGATLAEATRGNRRLGGSEALRRTARKLLRHEIDFIPNPEFRAANAAATILDAQADAEFAEATDAKERLRKDLPGHLAVMCEATLLSRDDEQRLFQQMNFLKYRANVRRSSLDPESPDAEAVQQIRRDLIGAKRIRDQILSANMRLVISIVKRFVTPQHSFDELLSDGIMSLMHAVEKFDYDRGFRFSTYAYRAIARNAYRKVTGQRQQKLYAVGDAGEELFEVESSDGSSSMPEHVWEALHGHLGAMMEKLDRRERFILRGRYALGAHRKARTFQCLADKLGISKERVRQLEQRAVAKLKSMAAEIDVDDLPRGDTSAEAAHGGDPAIAG